MLTIKTFNTVHVNRHKTNLSIHQSTYIHSKMKIKHEHLDTDHEK